MKAHDAGLSPEMLPDTKVNVREIFGLNQDLMCPAFSQRTGYVPEIDPTYRFDPEPRWPFWRASPSTAA